MENVLTSPSSVCKSEHQLPPALQNVLEYVQKGSHKASAISLGLLRAGPPPNTVVNPLGPIPAHFNKVNVTSQGYVPTSSALAVLPQTKNNSEIMNSCANSKSSLGLAPIPLSGVKRHFSALRSDLIPQTSSSRTSPATSTSTSNTAVGFRMPAHKFSSDSVNTDSATDSTTANVVADTSVPLQVEDSNFDLHSSEQEFAQKSSADIDMLMDEKALNISLFDESLEPIIDLGKITYLYFKFVKIVCYSQCI